MDLPYFLRHFNIPKRYGFISKLNTLITEPTVLDLRSMTGFKNIDIILEKNNRNELGQKAIVVHFKQNQQTTKLENEEEAIFDNSFELDL